MQLSFFVLEFSTGGTPPPSYNSLEDELRELRLNLLMEIEKRTQAEESLEQLQNLWQRLFHQLSLLGLSLPISPNISEDVNKQSNLDPVEELSQQIVVTRFVADAVSQGCARAEVELEMEPQIAAKNFEITRLKDRLQYCEAANREMSQRNQEAVGENTELIAPLIYFSFYATFNLIVQLVTLFRLRILKYFSFFSYLMRIE